jgi:hypothetical protein
LARCATTVQGSHVMLSGAVTWNRQTSPFSLLDIFRLILNGISSSIAAVL